MLRKVSSDARDADQAIQSLRAEISGLRQDARNGIKVRLDIDAGNLRADVQAALSVAGSGQGITTRLDIDTAHLRAEVEAALTAAGSGQGLAVRLDVDAAHLRDDVQTALTTAGAGQALSVRLDVDASQLRADVQAALGSAGAGQGLDIALHLTNTMQLRRDVQNAVRWAAWGHRIEIPLVLRNPNALRAQVTAAVRAAALNQRIRIPVTADTSRLRTDVTSLNRTLNRAGQSAGEGFQGSTKDLALFAAALLPIAAGAVPVATNLLAAGAGAAAFGIAIAGQLASLGQAAEAQKKLDDAIAEHGPASAEAAKASEAQQRAIAKLPPATREAAAAYAQLKDDYQDFSDALADDTMPVATHGMQIMSTILPKLAPMAAGAADEFDRLFTYLAGKINTPGFDRLMDRLENASTGALHDIVNGVISLSEASDNFDGGGDVQEFLRYARENGPLVAETVRNLAMALMHLLAASADTGISLLSIANALAKVVNAVPTEALSTFLQLYTAFKLVSLGAAALTAVTGSRAAAGLSAFVRSAQFGGVGAAVAGVTQRMSTLQKVAGSLGVLAVVAIGIDELAKKARGAPPDVDRLADSLKHLSTTGKFTGELQKTFGDMDGFIAKVGKLRTESKAMEDVKPFLAFTGLGAFADDAVSKVDDLVRGTESLGATKDDFKAFDESLASLVKGGDAKVAAEEFQRFETALRGAGLSTKEINELIPQYKNSVAALKDEQEIAARGMGLFGQQAIDTKSKLDAQKASADGLRQSIQALNDVNRAGGSAMAAFEQSIDDVTAAVGKHAGALKMSGGELDLGTDKAREAEKALSTLAANTDAATAAAREQGKSWEHINGIYKEGRDTFIKAADDMGLTRAQAVALADAYLKIPDKKSVTLEMRTEDALAGLNSVISAIEKTPNAKSVTVSALTSDAVSMLETLGFKVVQLKDGKFKVTAETGTAGAGLDVLKNKRDGLKDKSFAINASTQETIAQLEGVKKKVASTNGKTITMKAPTAEARQQLEALGFKIKSTKGKTVTVSVPTGTQRANVGSLASAIAGLRNRSVTVTYTTVYKIKGSPGGPPSGTYYGSTAGRSADGNIYAPARRMQRFADGGMRQEKHVAQIAQPNYRMWAEPETGGESYIPLSRSKRPRSRAIAEETVRRLGGNPDDIQWNANGSVTDWRYDPQTGSLYSASDAGSAGNKTKKVKVKVKGKTTTKEVSYFDIGAVEKKLISAGKATSAWNRDLEKVAETAGGDVAEALASMGKDGVALTKKMANGSKKYIAQMSIALRQLSKTARASLTDYKVQLNHATGNQELFAKNLAKLAAQGFGDLAGQLAAQNDEAAQQLAATAASDKTKAAGANAAAKRANNALSPDQVQDLVSIIAAVKNSKTGIHDVAATTGLGEDEIISTATKATSQIKTALGSRATQFLADLVKAQKGLAYANGGIRAGLYATRAGAVTFAEPSTGGEAYIPLGANKRRHAMPVLSDVAGRFGVGLTDGNSGRVVIIREQGPLVGSQTWQITSGGNAEDTARKVDANSSYQLRRLARGGVGARG
jgi:hypothetical protein